MTQKDEYYLLIDGETSGPYTLAQLREMWDAKGIPLDTLYARPGLKECLPVDQLLHQIITHKEPEAPRPKPPIIKRVATVKWVSIYSVILILVVVFFWSIGPFFRKYVMPANVVTASVQASRATVVILNRDDEDWTDKIISLNERPPDGFQTKLSYLAAGRSATLSLIEFKNQEGQRFQPWSMTVRDVWIGGGEKDFVRIRVPLK